MGAYVQCFCRHIECEEKGDIKAKLASEDLNCCCKWCISSRVIPASLNATVTRLLPDILQSGQLKPAEAPACRITSQM